MAIRRPDRARDASREILMGRQDTRRKGDSTGGSTTPMLFRVPDDVREALVSESRRTGVPMTTIVVRGLRRELGLGQDH